MPSSCVPIILRKSIESGQKCLVIPTWGQQRHCQAVRSAGKGMDLNSPYNNNNDKNSEHKYERGVCKGYVRSML